MASAQQLCAGSGVGILPGRVASTRASKHHRTRPVDSCLLAGSARKRVQTRVMLDPMHLVDALGVQSEALSSLLTGMASHLPLAYEPVAAPCSMMKCGDVLHRSTLDKVLRGEQTGPDWRAFLLLASVAAYLFAPPGVLPGAIDYYILAKLRLQARAYGKDDITLGRKLAAGGFGTVYKADLKMDDGTVLPVIVKKATEFGQAEAWMCERMLRLPGKPAAEFITAFDEFQPGEAAKKGAKKVLSGEGGAVWLVWKYEGDSTLWNVMESKDFPYNLELKLLDRQLRLPRGVQRQAVTIRLAFKQLLEALAAAHATGIVHRDIKPQNCIVSDSDKKIKLIDLGAAADLRVGINYIPAEYLLDPRYSPPQQYIMSTQTPTPPPAPVAAFLSPVLWRMESPDRFDMWSCGVTLLQMVFPSLRSDDKLIMFNKRLEGLGYDLNKWRAEEEAKKGSMRQDMVDGFALLDLDDRAGWQLLCDLMAFKPTDRCTAAEALQSRFFADPLPAVAVSRTALSSATKAINKTLDSEMFSSFASSATGKDRGSLTEAQLRQELGLDEVPTKAPQASNTIVWWKERQNAMRKSKEKREGSGGSSGLQIKGANGSKAAAPAKAGSPGRENGRNGNGKNGNGRASTPALSSLDGNSAEGKATKPGFAGLFGGLKSGEWMSSPSRRSVDVDDSYLGAETDSEPDEIEEVAMVGAKSGGKGKFDFFSKLRSRGDSK